MPRKKNLILAASAVIVLLVAYNTIFRWPALEQAEDKQQKLIAAIEDRQWGRVQRLTSEGYADSLGLDRDQLIRWRKTGRLPWKWQLASVHHADATLPPDYRPGEIRTSFSRGEF